MISGDVFVTPHAVRQFISRIAPQLDYDEALWAIIHELRDHGGEPKPLESGRGIRVRTRGGRYSFRAVIAPGDPQPVVVTVLRSGR